ncbi:unnamed protein product (macronuclear) [Paramecium tetraurelia]|uniref:Chromosome undetermined scaffold_267, whole genome shotgun sequence n=1 Tax=Paramecium tetraurelia TaxID=5888 RepID=A0CT16_PARTE|nr:uncharacterized protein GSPATT00038951001 [Paramecium tetraurelia]XP_001450473.1 uncharacterized protein GSPATT00017433001 [Paramecium tetraurelia]XP_001452973.1 uncharacterized protein GSPATT00019293001 [Paramecium tetraurelia]CAK73933.1 unnamed protein product [Paramecium tetraurelia]CAK83076.1 unnamed protein product [Paramecium tetraurelia]CAK85576.1 unnamed protein product [Paramecium tetraurelia]|eukprot:XP_001441330.1 hypothetical protein (macronuclear) [Paramecium tetraurelia strain d4-2]
MHKQLNQVILTDAMITTRSQIAIAKKALQSNGVIQKNITAVNIVTCEKVYQKYFVNFLR